MKRALLCLFVPVFAAVAQPNAPRATITETLRLDATKEDFPTVGRVFVGPKGRIVVVLPQDRQMRWYDSTGRRIGAIGKNGEGPGEFQSIGTGGWIADTLWVYDGRLRRTTLIAPDAKFLRTIVQPAQMTWTQKAGEAPVRMIGAGPFAFFADGSSIVYGFGLIKGADGRERGGDEQLARMDRTGTAIVVHTPTPSNDPRWMLEVSGFGNPVPFRLMPDLAGSYDGARMATIWANVVGDTGSFTVTLMNAKGERAFSRAYPFKGTPIPQRAIDSTLATFLPKPGQPTEGPSDLGQRMQVAAKQKMPAVYTPVTGIILGLDNTIWIPMRPTPTGREVLVLDGRGNPIGSVMLPPRTTLRQANLTTMWATQSDEDGLTSVVRYRLRPISCQACR